MSIQDELTTTLCLAIQRLTQVKKAGLLLNTALALIEDGKYGEDVDTYLDVCLKTPGLPKEDKENILLAQKVNGRKLGGGELQCAPVNTPIHFSVDPAFQRMPPQIWEEIATQTPRYHLRKWLSISPLHRDIASRQIFHTVDIRFAEFSNYDRGLDFLERAISDPVFASRVKSLRLHWDYEEVSYEEGDTLDFLLRIVKISLLAFKALRNFEWIGNFEMPIDLVEVLLSKHKCLQGLGFRGGHLDAVAASTFQNLRNFTFGINELDEADSQAIRDVLDRNESTLKHLVLGGPCLEEDDTWDLVFKSLTINNLIHIGFFSQEISNSVLNRLTDAHNLQSLALHGSFVDSQFASEVFATRRLVQNLESFTLVMEDIDEDVLGYVTWHFLRKRETLRRLDLGSCLWDMIQGILPTLINLRVLSVCLEEFEEQIESLVKSIPKQMVAIRLSIDISDSDTPLDEYAHHFTRFNNLSFLHFQLSTNPVKPRDMSEEDFQMQTDKSLRSIAASIPSLDFLACYGELYIVVRSHGDIGPTVTVKAIPTSSRLEYGSGANVISEDIAWLQQKLKDEPIEF